MGKTRCNNGVKLLGFARRGRSALLAGTALQAAAVLVLSLPAEAQPAPNTRPLGGTVVGGTASISRGASNTAIDQSSQRAAIDWNSFDVGSQQSVTFNQPSASSVTLNRVIGPNPSQIAGRIDANGQIVLVNQSGVTFYQGAQVNTSGLMVSAAGISNQNFMAGVMKFDQPAQPNAKVENQGTITIRQAGLAALVAPQVVNSGTISARLGHVVLAGAKTATLDLYGDGLLSLDVTNQVTQAPSGATALVTNTGVIVADGGTVQLTARAADGVVQNLVQAGGSIRAASVGNRVGTVALNGVGGSIIVEGQLAAPGMAPGTTGGAIEVATTGNVTVASTARIDASGKAGGGVVAIGTTLARAKAGPSATPAQTAKNVTVRRGATIAASATHKGDGGHVTLLSTDATSMAGRIAAKGGTQGGNGGFVEVSGGAVSLTGRVDTSAPLGATGQLLLDMSDLWLSDTQPAVATFAITGGNLPTVGANQAPDAATVSWVSPSLLAAQNANISLAATDNLFVASSFGTANTLNLGTHTLTLTGGTGLTIDRGFTIAAGGMSLTTLAGAITLNGSSGVTGGLITAAQLAVLTPTSLLASNATTPVTMAGGGGIALADATLGSGATPLLALDLSAAAGGITQSAAGAIAAGTLRSASGVGGTVNLAGTANNIAAVGSFAVTGGSFTLVDNGNAGNVAVSGPVTATNVAIGDANTGTIGVSGSIGATGTLALSSGSGGIALNAGEILSGATIDLSATGGGITQSAAGTIAAGTLQSTSGVTGTVNLAGTANNIAAVGSFAVTGGSFTLVDNGNAGNLAVSGPVTATNVTIGDANTGTIGVSGSIGATGTLALSSGSGGIAFGGTADLSAATLDLSASGGGVREAASTAISAGTLQSTGGVTGSVDLSGSVNAIANLGAFVVSSDGFTLVDSASLTVIGGVGADNIGLTTPGAGRIDVQAEMLASGGTIALTSGSGGVVVGTGGSVLGLSLIAIDGGSGGIAISGTGNIGSASGVVDLNSTGGITEDATATLNAGVLQSSLGVSGNVSLPNAAMAKIGDFAVTGGSFTLNDSIGLSVFGALTATKSATITDSGTLAVSGTIGAPAIALTAGEIDIPGLVTDSGGGTVNLVATAGSISETGTLIAGMLTGSIAAGGTLVFFGDLNGASPTTNQIATLGNFTAVSLSLDDGRDLTVAGTIATSTPGSATINVAGTLTVAGTILGASTSLGADRIDIPGLINVGAFGLTLNAGTDGISETGTLTAALLSGYSSGPASFIGSNSISAVPGFTASSFTLKDGTPVEVGILNGGSSVAIDSTGGLGITGPLTGGAVSLTGSNISIVLALTGTTSVTLTATQGGIGGIGVVNTPLLSGSATGGVFLAGLNTIAALGDFTASGFTLNNNKDLSINGTLAGGPFVSITNGGSLTVNGSIMASSVSLAGANLTIPGFVSDGGDGTTSLIATAGTIGETGTLIAGTLSGSSVGATNLTGATTTTNQVAALGNFSAAIFNLNDGISLTIGGSVNGGPLAGILDNGVLTVGGTLAATNIGLTAFGLAIPGTVGDGGSGSVSLHATAGAITETGTLIAGVLGGDATGAASFAGASLTANRVATIGGFSATGFTLDDGSNLSIDATVNGGASIAIAGTGAISETGFGALVATTLTGGAGGVASFTGANQIPTLGNFNAAGFTLNDVRTLNIAGSLNGGASAQLISTGSINETGTIVAATLSGSAAGPANFTGTNQLGALGNFSSAGFTLTNNQDLAIAGSVNGGSSASIGVAGALTITGNVTANTILLSATGGMTIPGSVVDANSVTLTAGGSIDETGTLVAGLLTGSATGNASLTGGGNQVANLGSFTAGGSFALTDATDLLIGATLTAPKIVIDAGGNQIVFADGAAIVTGGTARPPGVLTSFPSAASSAGGAFLSAGNFVQQGNSFLAGLAGGSDIVRIDASGGRISLDQTGGLQGPQTWLILGLTSAEATGNLFVQTLDLQYAGASSASLAGSIAGLTGVAAAGAAGILPAPNANFRFNSCVIGSVNCVLLPSENVPTANPLNELDIGTLSSPDEQDDMLLPIVSEWDY